MPFVQDAKTSSHSDRTKARSSKFGFFMITTLTAFFAAVAHGRPHFGTFERRNVNARIRRARRATVQLENINRFNVAVGSFGPHVLEPYTSCNELEMDVANALRAMADIIIDRNVRLSDDGNGVYEEEVMAMSDLGAGGAGGSSYDTNVQVEDVDEADTVKSDGRLIFAVYGSDLVAMGIDGTIITRLTIPPPLKTTTNNEDDIGRGASFPQEDATPERTIEGILLSTDSKYITVLTHYFEPWNYENPRVAGGGVTTVLTYAFDGVHLVLMSSFDIMGSLNTARMIGNQAHVVTEADIYTYGFTGQLNRYNEEYENMTSSEYEEAAFERAKSTVFQHAKKTVDQLRLRRNDDKCGHITRISNMTKQNNVEDNPNLEAEAMMNYVPEYVPEPADVLSSFAQITSFDVRKSPFGMKDDAIHVAGAFTSMHNPKIYTNNETIVLAGSAYVYDPPFGSRSDYTFLMRFGLEEGKALPNAVGEVTGRVPDQFCMDYHGGEFRVATAISSKWVYVKHNISGLWRYEKVSDATARITKMKVENMTINEIGHVQGLGEEWISSCRFFGDRAYIASTGEEDSLYAIEMNSDITPNPSIMGKLDTNERPTYIHPIGEENEFLLTIGQKKDENGFQKGLQISVFDVTTSNITKIHNHVVTQSAGHSSSAAEFDHRAFRYFSEARKLILPVRINQFRSSIAWDGFVVYDVDLVGGIEQVGNVTHANSTTINGAMDWNCPVDCFDKATLNPRSMVFSGVLVTFKGHSVKLNQGLMNLNDVWMEDLDGGRSRFNGDDCYPWFEDDHWRYS